MPYFLGTFRPNSAYFTYMSIRENPGRVLSCSRRALEHAIFSATFVPPREVQFPRMPNLPQDRGGRFRIHLANRDDNRRAGIRCSNLPPQPGSPSVGDGLQPEPYRPGNPSFSRTQGSLQAPSLRQAEIADSLRPYSEKFPFRGEFWRTLVRSTLPPEDRSRFR